MATMKELNHTAEEIDLIRALSYKSHWAIKSPPNVHNASERAFVAPMYDPQGSILPPIYPQRRESLPITFCDFHHFDRTPVPMSPISRHSGFSDAEYLRPDTGPLPPCSRVPNTQPIALVAPFLDIDHTHLGIPPCPVEKNSSLGWEGTERSVQSEAQDFSMRNIEGSAKTRKKFIWERAIAAHLLMFSTL